MSPEQSDADRSVAWNLAGANTDSKARARRFSATAIAGVVAALLLGIVLMVTLVLPSTGPPNFASTDGWAAIPPIRGMTPAHVYGKLTKMGFTKAGPVAGKIPKYYEWHCVRNKDDVNYHVIILGHATDEVAIIIATVLNYGRGDTDAIAREFLGHVASLSYDGAEPESAKAWVASHIGQETQITIAGVTFFTSADSTDTVRSLRVTADQ